MFLRKSRVFLSKVNGTVNNQKITTLSYIAQCRLCSQGSGGIETYELFFNEKVQYLLKKLTRPSIEKIFRQRKDEKPLDAPTYQFMTTAELEQAKKEAEEKGMKKLKMPPVLPIREEDNYVFSIDEELKGYCNSKFVFTDITFSTTDRSRAIVVREPDGVLRKARVEEKSRMNEVYFPRPGRKLTPPEMFSEPYLQSLLDRGEYEFILERACAQFEPDEASFMKVCERTYSAVDSSGAHEALRSTRHYGPMVFFLVRTKSVDNLLIENLKTDRLEDAVWLITLYRILHPDSRPQPIPHSKGDQLEFVKDFIEHDLNGKEELVLAFRALKDLLSGPKLEELNAQG